jgi:hypothetical protein
MGATIPKWSDASGSHQYEERAVPLEPSARSADTRNTRRATSEMAGTDFH